MAKQFDSLEVEELVEVVLGLTEEQINDNPDHEQLIFDKFGIDLDPFVKVAESLLPFTIGARTAITGDACQGYVKDQAFIVMRKMEAA